MTTRVNCLWADSFRLERGGRRSEGSRVAAKLMVVGEDFANVDLRFVNRRHAAVSLHPILARVIGGDGERDIAVEAVQEIAEVLRAAANVLYRIERVADA